MRNKKANQRFPCFYFFLKRLKIKKGALDFTISELIGFGIVVTILVIFLFGYFWGWEWLKDTVTFWRNFRWFGG